MESMSLDYKDSIMCIMEKISLGEYDLAKQLTYQLMHDEEYFALGHNIFGAIYEINGRFNLAIKHYRAACDLDPTFSPASKNMSRLCQYPIRFGLEYISLY